MGRSCGRRPLGNGFWRHESVRAVSWRHRVRLGEYALGHDRTLVGTLHLALRPSGLPLPLRLRHLGHGLARRPCSADHLLVLCQRGRGHVVRDRSVHDPPAFGGGLRCRRRRWHSGCSHRDLVVLQVRGGRFAPFQAARPLRRFLGLDLFPDALGPPGLHVWGPKDFSGKRGGAEVRGESGVCRGPEAFGGSAVRQHANLVPLMSPKARFKSSCMRLRIRASFGDATWLHSHEKETNSRQPWRGYRATRFSASRGGYKFGASLGEATYYFAPAFLGKLWRGKFVSLSSH